MVEQILTEKITEAVKTLYLTYQKSEFIFNCSTYVSVKKQNLKTNNVK